MGEAAPCGVRPACVVLSVPERHVHRPTWKSDHSGCSSPGCATLARRRAGARGVRVSLAFSGGNDGVVCVWAV